MEPVSILTRFGWAALLFGAVLVVAPCVQVARDVHPAKRVVGLWVAGSGFLLLGLGLAFPHYGLAPAVLPGIVLTVVGHVWQRRVMKGT